MATDDQSAQRKRIESLLRQPPARFYVLLTDPQQHQVYDAIEVEEAEWFAILQSNGLLPPSANPSSGE